MVLHQNSDWNARLYLQGKIVLASIHTPSTLHSDRPLTRMAEVYVVVHIATTLDEIPANVPRDGGELISLSWCTVNSTTMEILARESLIVKPTTTSVISSCSKRYNLSTEEINKGLSFKNAIAQFDVKLAEELGGRDFSFVTVDIHSLRVLLPREARDKGVFLPVYLQHPRVFDLYNEYLKWQKTHPEAMSYPSSNLKNLIVALGAETAPLGSEDLPEPADSIVEVYAQILKLLIQKSVPVDLHPSVLTKPYDTALDAKYFLEERSKILYLSNLSPDTTHPELESWFGHFGCRPVAFWALRSVEADLKPNIYNAKSRSISGFAIFANHEEAAEALILNGRSFMDRVVEVQASSIKVFDRAADLLNTFPPLKNRPRPGDWTCPSCGFSNFQRRIACFRCSFPAASAVVIQEQMYTGPSVGQDGKIRRSKPDDKQLLNNYRGYQDPYPGSHHAVKHGGNYNPGYNHGYNNHNYSSGGQRNHHGNSVPFRAGDWKCTNESCQYHNFAKNLSCLKCGASKPSQLPGQHSNAGNSNRTDAGSNKLPSASIHSVNSTAAAIAAATASGQPLNLNRNYFGMYQPQVNHNGNGNGNGNGTFSSNGASAHNASLYANLSNLQQLQMQQANHQGNLYLPQHLASLQGHNQAQGARRKSSQVSEGPYYGQQSGAHYRGLLSTSVSANDSGIELLNSQIENMALNKAQEK